MRREYARAMVEGSAPPSGTGAGAGAGVSSSSSQRDNNVHLRNNTRTILLLPDLIIFWAVVTNYQREFSHVHVPIPIPIPLRLTGSVPSTDRKEDGDVAVDVDVDVDLPVGDDYSPIGLVRVAKDEGNDVDEEESEVEGPIRANLSESGVRAVHATAKICFRIYDGFQKKGNVTRDTVHRFLSDIHGEETHARPHVKQVLDQMFAVESSIHTGIPKNTRSGQTSANINVNANVNVNVNANGAGKEDDLPTRYVMQLTESQFIDAMQKTVHVAQEENSPTCAIDHILFDWFVRLGGSILPHYLSDMEHFFTSAPNNIGIGTLLQSKLDLVRSKTADTAIKKLYRKFDIIDDGMGVGKTINNGSRLPASNHMHLFDVRRRFQSIIAKGNEIRGDSVKYENNADADDKSCSTMSSSLEEEGHHLPIEECDETSPSKTSTLRIGDLPKNAIDEDAFVHAVSTADNDLGHGGFIPTKAAQLLFQAGCLRSEENIRRESSRTHLNTLMNTGAGAGARDSLQNSSRKLDGQEKNYWELHDVLAFGCNAVRGELVDEDFDIPMLEYAFLMFTMLSSNEFPGKSSTVPATIETTQQSCNLDSRVLTRDTVGQMLILLLEHFSFRSQADSPEGEFVDNNIGNVIDKENAQVDASAAALLGLLPHSIDDANTDDRRVVPLELLVNQVYIEAGKNNQDPTDILYFTDFVKWCKNYSDPHKSMEQNEQKIHPLLMDLRLIGSIVFGIKPVSPIMERVIVDEVRNRFKYRHPPTNLAKRGPSGTIWYIIEVIWWKEWLKYSKHSRPSPLAKIANNQLLVDNGNIALRAGLRFRYDFEVCNVCALYQTITS